MPRMRNSDSFRIPHFVIFDVQGVHFSKENDIDGLEPLNSGENNGILVFSFITVTKCSVLAEEKKLSAGAVKFAMCHYSISAGALKSSAVKGF